jgi:hypothetical protein
MQVYINGREWLSKQLLADAIAHDKSFVAGRSDRNGETSNSK